MKESRVLRDYRPWIPRMVDALVEHFHPVKVILFGSYARGDFDHDSDVDFLLVLPDSELPEGRLRRRKNIEARGVLGDFPCPSDVIVTTPGELERYRNLVGYIFRPALLEGKVVYER